MLGVDIRRAVFTLILQKNVQKLYLQIKTALVSLSVVRVLVFLLLQTNFKVYVLHSATTTTQPNLLDNTMMQTSFVLENVWLVKVL